MIEENSKQIRELKFSPSGETLAVGADPHTLELYSSPDLIRRAVLKKHSGPVNHIDWAGESPFLQTNSAAQELLYFNTANTASDLHVTQIGTNIRNEPWHTLSCVFGWSVQGIWKDDLTQGTEINIVDRSSSKFFKEYEAIATAEDNCLARVYKYPCVQTNANSVSLVGHSSFVSNVKWTPDDKYIITTGGEDQTIIVWKVEKAI